MSQIRWIMHFKKLKFFFFLLFIICKIMLLNTFIYLLKGSIDPVTMQYNYIVCFTRMDTNSQYIIILFFFGGGGLKIELNCVCFNATNSFSLYWEPKMQLMVVGASVIWTTIKTFPEDQIMPTSLLFPSFPCSLIISDKSIVSAGRVFFGLY